MWDVRPHLWICVCVCADPWQTLNLRANQIGDAGVASLAEGALAQLTVRSHTLRFEARGLVGVGCAPSPWLCVCVYVC